MGIFADQINKTFNTRKVGILEFAESDEFCNRPLYPLQRVLLKIIFLEDLEGWEEDVLQKWIDRSDEGEICHGIREKIDYLRDHNYQHFPEIVLVGGRRSSKGYISAIALAKVIYETQKLGDPGFHYKMDPRKEIYFACVAASLDQAKKFQYADLAGTVADCKAIEVSKIQETNFKIPTSSDRQAVLEMENRGTKVRRDFSKLRGVALAANADTLRGSATLGVVFDEMAFMMEGNSGSSADKCYAALKPSLDQFRQDAIVFLNSSPATKIGKFYEKYEEANKMDGRHPAFPRTLSMKFPSWELYKNYHLDERGRFSLALMVSPDVDETRLNEPDRAQCLAAREEERSDPDTFKVERRGDWMEVRDAYLDPDRVDDAFVPEWNGRLMEENRNSGTNLYRYKMHCFTGDTRIMTEFGHTTLRGAADLRSVKVLSQSEWREATVSSFGWQTVKSVVLERQGIQKTIRATPEHLWILKNHKSVRTDDLKSGDVLDATKAHKRVKKMSPFGIAHGFAFGDGSGTNVYFHRPKDESMMKFFEFCDFREEPDKDRMVAMHCPRFFKSLPSIEESHAYLYGWLAGYLAADGTVSEIGRVSISSASYEALEFVREVCDRLGILTWRITSHNRKGYGAEETALYRIQICASDLSEDFFLLEAHQQRFKARCDRQISPKINWRVLSVTDLDEEEEVFCATVPDYHKFALEDNIQVHNCDPSSTTAGFGFACAHVEHYPNDKGEVMPHVIFDFVHKWDPAEFEKRTIDWQEIIPEIVSYVNNFRPEQLTFDQHQAAMAIQTIRGKIKTGTYIGEKFATQKINYNRFEIFKTALNLGYVHVPPGCRHSALAMKELKFLQRKGGFKIDHPSEGDIQTKDIADCIIECTYYLLTTEQAFLGLLNQQMAMGAQGGFGSLKRQDPMSALDALRASSRRQPMSRATTGIQHRMRRR